MKEEHDRAVCEQNKKRYSAKTFAEPWEMQSDGYTATLLTSPLDIANEGMTQRHCVASYAHSARAGKYAVFRIDGKERATLGVSVFPPGGAQVDQCYSACNGRVSDATRAFAGRVCVEYRRTRLGSKILNPPLAR